MIKNGEDWRLTDQEEYMKNLKLYHTNYTKNNHDHCEFCFYKFEKKEQIGYCTTDYYRWICEECYKDFKEVFDWKVVNE